MENIKLFLETSTIHGMTFIPITKKYVRLFWILVIFGGFTGAAVIIRISFQAWDESPIKTTIETLPMDSSPGFPKITVCPPRNTFTNLNYDLIQAEKMTFDNETRNNLIRFAMNSLQELHSSWFKNSLPSIKNNVKTGRTWGRDSIKKNAWIQNHMGFQEGKYQF